MANNAPDDVTYRLVNDAFRIVFRLLGLRFDVRGAEHVPSDGPAVLAANHIGFLDFTFVGLAASRRHRLVRFMAKQAVFDHPLSGPLLRRMRHIPVDRSSGAAAYRRAIRELTAGQLVGVFPEATISRAWTLKPFKPGAAALAVREQVPLIPVVAWGGHRLFTVDGHRSLRRGTAVTVLVGPPIHPRPRDTVGDVTAELRRRMQALLDQAQRDYPDRPRDDTDRWWQPAHLGGTAPTPDAAADLDRAAGRPSANDDAHRALPLALMTELPLAPRPLSEPHPSRLAADDPSRPAILAAHVRALNRGEPGYLDPRTGLFVLTAAFLAERGTCCARGCRHCPYVV